MQKLGLIERHVNKDKPKEYLYEIKRVLRAKVEWSLMEDIMERIKTSV
jgi:hypothetical protein